MARISVPPSGPYAAAWRKGVAGRWQIPSGPFSLSSGTYGQNYLTTIRMVIDPGSSLVINGLAIRVDTGLSGGLSRLAIIQADASGNLGTVLRDTGAVIDVSTTGVKTLDLTSNPVVLPGPGVYWLAHVQQGAAGNVTMAQTAAYVGDVSYSSPTLALLGGQGWRKNGVTGAIPNNLGEGDGLDTRCVMIAVRMG